MQVTTETQGRGKLEQGDLLWQSQGSLFLRNKRKGRRETQSCPESLMGETGEDSEAYSFPAWGTRQAEVMGEGWAECFGTRGVEKQKE